MRLPSAALFAVAAVLALAAGPAGAAKTTCYVKANTVTLDKYETRLHSLSVVGTGCTMGHKVIDAYQACRTKNGPAGRCVKKVLGYACRSGRTGSSGSFYEKVVCGKGAGATAKQVRFAFDAVTGG